ncbi:CRISPR-associated helicase Cas3' [Sporolactobacillus sp. STCC-11]|uniref:CRISPR-associated helicase Cas3' n=1 Tax=Sporolactobacillus caesalpiniae TaxID=3230362 RepID=UPI00339A6499
MNIADYLNKDAELFAHVDGVRRETLKDHSNLVMDYFHKLSKHNQLSLDNLLNSITFDGEPLNQEDIHFIRNEFENAILFHDIGKINSEFQRVKMGQRIERSAFNNSNHSLLSALLYLDISEERLTGLSIDIWKKAFLRYIMVIFSYVISRHHTYLTDFNLHDYAQKLNALYLLLLKNEDVLRYYSAKEQLPNMYFLEQNSMDATYYLENENNCISDEDEGTSLYLLAKMLYSCLVTSDFMATYQFFNQNEPQFYFLNKADKKVLLNQFKTSGIYQSVQSYRDNPEHSKLAPINQLRARLFIETEEQLVKHIDRSIYYLEAPTGSGKTVVSVNLALNLLERRNELNKIIYIFPFNTLIEQTKNKLDEWFSVLESRYRIQVVNSVTPIVRVNEMKDRDEKSLSEDVNYDEELLRRQLLQYPVTLTSHVNFFNHLFGTGRESNLGLATLANSVVILDEIQSYRNDIWPEMIKMLNDMSERYNIVLIIMSATLPKLDKLLKTGETFTPLVVNKNDYFLNPIFKDRVRVNFDLLRERKLSIDQLVQEIKRIKEKHGAVRLLVELIKKTSARTLYHELRNVMPDQTIIELTGDDSRYVRSKMIALIQGTKDHPPIRDVIILATQVIEAGVDIDMDIGMKDISLLDSEEQFLGRINRASSKKDSWSYFFDLDASSSIYGKDLRLEKDLRNSDYQKALVSKNFDDFYQLVFQRFAEIRRKRNDDYHHFDQLVNELQFPELAKYLSLINQKTYSLVLNFSIEMNGGKTTGEATWNLFKQLLRDNEISYAEKQVRLSEVSEKLDYFTFSTFKEPQFYDEKIGNMYYVQDGERYVEWDEIIGASKFRPEKYDEDSEGDLL